MSYEIERKQLESVIDSFFIASDKVTSLRTSLYAMGLGKKPEVTDILKEMSGLGLMLCGGAINSIFTAMPINDLDFYMQDPSKQAEAVAFLQKWFPEPTYISGNAITFKRKSSRSRKVWTVQLITRFHGQPQDIFDTFDFTITQCCFDFRNDRFQFGDRFFQDVAKRRLVYLGTSRFPICALWRTQKYQARGYKLPGSTIMHISLSIVRLDIKTYKQLKEQLMGIDTSYLQNLLNSTKYDDALPVDYGAFLVDAFEYIDGVSHNQDEFQASWEENVSPIQ